MISSEVHPAPPPSLADRLRDATADLHREAERTGVVADLLRGRAHLAAYGIFLRNLLPVYEALERGLERHRDSLLLGRLARPDLYRAAALRADIAALGGSHEPALPAAYRYAEAIEAAAEGRGERLVAHAYVRYLGDLNGGQILARLIGRRLALEPDRLTFYAFLGDPGLLAVDYRAAIDAVGRMLAGQDAIVATARDAFRFSIGLSQDVAQAAGMAAAAP